MSHALTRASWIGTKTEEVALLSFQQRLKPNKCPEPQNNELGFSCSVRTTRLDWPPSRVASFQGKGCQKDDRCRAFQEGGAECAMHWPFHAEVAGELRVGALAFAPHLADPRLIQMYFPWKPWQTPLCGRLGKVMSVGKGSVKLYCCGYEVWWDIPLFDASLTRYCYKGCKLQQGEVALAASAACSVCLARLPVGAETMLCHEHNYTICDYCLGRPRLPAVGEKVIRGPTSLPDSAVSEEQDYYEEGIVETGLLEGTDLEGIQQETEVSSSSSWFQVRWLKSGSRSHCRGPPFQDVIPALSNGLTGLKPSTRCLALFMVAMTILEDRRQHSAGVHAVLQLCWTRDSGLDLS